MENKIPSEKYNKDKSFQTIATELYNDYLLLGSFEKVARKYGRTRERIRQILVKGNSKGLFKYPPEKPELPPSITPEQLRKDFFEYGSVMGIVLV